MKRIIIGFVLGVFCLGATPGLPAKEDTAAAIIKPCVVITGADSQVSERGYHRISHEMEVYRTLESRRCHPSEDSGDRQTRPCDFQDEGKAREGEPDGAASGSQPFGSEQNPNVIGGWLRSLTFAFGGEHTLS